MKLFGEAVIVFVITLIIQYFWLIIIERIKRKDKLNIEEEYKKNNIIIVKMLVAILIAIFCAVIYFYGMGILTTVRALE